jgi:hypothetical protein
MPYVRDSFWRGRDFTGLEAMQHDALEWSVEVAGARRHPGLDGAAPAAVFAAVEAPALKPLPRRRFVVATWSTGKVAADIHVKVGPALYSAPWRLIGQQVQARSTATTVQLVHDGTVVATHVRAERGRRTNPDHYPPEKIAFYQRTPTWCRTTAAAVGPACTTVIETLMTDNALYRLRAAQGILGLRNKYGTDALETACAAALTAGDPSYRTIKGILAIRTPAPADTGEHTARAAAAPAFLRGPDDLFAHDPPAHADPSAQAGPATPSRTGTTPDPGPDPAAVVHLPGTSTSGTTSGPARTGGPGTTNDTTPTHGTTHETAHETGAA